jgi:hypothetical protein
MRQDENTVNNVFLMNLLTEAVEGCGALSSGKVRERNKFFSSLFVKGFKKYGRTSGVTETDGNASG